ncbi:MAG: hypothetical protein UW01_C0007G0029 [Candidatus Nomurabacteria bacterium GW2011_GWA2_43_66]|uniref:Uncharacterized protein n=2 Tax=Candidatus Nomuraibacteriota TaxID=1752729 RepID=A0A0G1EMR6_9BACT|nr:MAG: hypothetical protein UV13_C0002G0015 [Parcubacteria group bacterium GW2011_GWC1_42_21]KKS58635.1 MAG: hypothetical protein UV23_C0003G0019 [Candidatus Nomurabacteria bacterium GW2011_GWF1_42_40]KKT00398.1 MAG: hypothetical protein UV77_C0004G0030 [Candidatus Nomurabacteria bacterium GW2011_GWA1_43_17]KKT07540.1 MAG: hypothetical protein UV85_C0010G0018 [Candidatus Nomurabacteria bacterium GW2011_GWB1_43_19]KKT11351.1 MAG: hypothetical protein UV91_C0007G0051 [Candidatus Nomurabacteria b
MFMTYPVEEARSLGCSFIEAPNGVVTGTLPASGEKPEVVIHSTSVVRAAIILLYAKEERDKKKVAK